MATAIKLPELGEGIKSADVVSVLVKPGDVIKKDQGVIEIESEKASAEVPSSVAGKIVEVRVKEGDKIKPGQVIITVEEGITAAAAAPAKSAEPKKQAPAAAPEPPKAALATAAASGKEPVFASPSVRQFAREIGVDIRTVPGSGPAGRISLDDVKNHARNLAAGQVAAPASAAARPAATPLPDFAKVGEVMREPMNAVRRATAAHMARCWAEIPHVTIFDRADITAAEELRKQYKTKAKVGGGKLTITAILLKVAAAALKTFPRVNASVDMAKQETILKRYYHIGCAVDTPRGLVVPVIRDADKKSILQIAAELAQLSEKARAGKLGLNDMQGGTFTITNLGGLGTTYFTPIVNAPEVAILGVGRAAMESSYAEGLCRPRLMLPLSLSFDHRVVDGADGARFLHWIVDAMEKPLLLAMEG
ncbi:MAG: 2-oxo acid dehydrogenase subunit E2 [Verrucomicrobia bacterium]|nr:2-oxo acid dehydrogenase subunit E2 [Verrucomicrobiota bacterium]